MNAERLRDNISAVNHEGDVVPIYDIEDIDIIDDDAVREHDEEVIDKIISGIEIHLPYGANAVSQLGQNAVNQAKNAPTIGESIRSHPSAQNESYTKISDLTKDLIAEYHLHAKGTKKALMIAVIRNWNKMSDEDRRAIAVEVGLAPDTFEKKDDSSPPKQQPTSDRSRFDDYAKAAANDHND